MAVSNVQSRTITASFRPNARLVSILGEQLISDPVVGLLELVKNGHDADATRVAIEMLRVRTSDACLIVEDDGFGMTAGDVQNRFLVPATDGKAKQKAKAFRTPGGRLPLGEKGIGRFATQALASQLEMITRSKGEPEVVLRVDWEQFRTDVALGDVMVEIMERAPEVFQGDWTGTRLVLTGLRRSWGHAELDRLQRGLRRLKSPFPRFGLLAFDIELSCPDYPKFQDLDPVDLEEFSHYKFRAEVDAEGRITYDYTCVHPAENLTAYNLRHTVPEALKLKSDDVWSEDDWNDDLDTPPPPRPTCGPFSLTLFVFDRDRKFLNQARKCLRNGAEFNGKDLDAICGISVFKDDVRVLPYGEPGNDWLRLDQERINDPAGKLGNKQVVGFLELSQSLNPGLYEKADREGLQENVAFHHLRQLAVAALDTFRVHWQADRPKKGHTAARVEKLRKDPRVTVLGNQDKPTGPDKGRDPFGGPLDLDEDDFDEAPILLPRPQENGGEDRLPALAVPADRVKEGPSSSVRLPFEEALSPSPLTPILILLAQAGTDIQDRVEDIRDTLAGTSLSGQQVIKESLEHLARWAASLGALRTIGCKVASEFDVQPAVHEVLQLLDSERQRLGISFRTLGGGFRADVGSGGFFLALYTVLRAAMADVAGRPKSDREILINLQSLDREVRVSWVSSKQVGSRQAAPGTDLLAMACEVLGSDGVRVDFRPQDQCVMLVLKPVTMPGSLSSLGPERS